ncbi:hypothetical protein UFOVP1328_61 [uncultured Caudovirales phage]|uniref:Uncharacterized protein n=1 Tax=uncultured Caudovirales phage TaxID=2100421 RepID=A0A6J5S2E2_9CAUD|nr:hypothetical protein UFOVP1084_18 [uncultured Caudovirales phage]CAB4199565.1 hypothetical protein UFOVP1328_61 [uncultured Caudovirales phage]CAB5228365.1 hypothetical protein UFOVP1532_29 [uncultured Caudovirales phage]
MSMFTDYNDIEVLRETIKRDRPTELYSKDGVTISNIAYGEEYGKEYAEIGWCLPDGCLVVLEDHGNNPHLGVAMGVRIWL